MTRVVIEFGDVSLEAELTDNETGREIARVLPLKGHANTWGDEIYFSIPVEIEQAADARAEMEIGELGYWPAGSAFCIFFGPTPASTGEAPRAASPVNPFGRVLGDTTALRSVAQGDAILVATAD